MPVGVFVECYQALRTGQACGYQKTPPWAQLVQPGLGNDIGSARYHDAVNRTDFGPAEVAIAGAVSDICEATHQQSRAGFRSQGRVDFNGCNLGTHTREDRGRVAKTRSDLKHMMRVGDIKQISQKRHYERLRSGGAAIYWQWRVSIGEPQPGGGHMTVTWHRRHRRQHVRAPVVPPQVRAEHMRLSCNLSQ